MWVKKQNMNLFEAAVSHPGSKANGICVGRRITFGQPCHFGSAIVKACCNECLRACRRSRDLLGATGTLELILKSRTCPQGSHVNWAANGQAGLSSSGSHSLTKNSGHAGMVRHLHHALCTLRSNSPKVPLRTSIHVLESAGTTKGSPSSTRG